MACQSIIHQPFLASLPNLNKAMIDIGSYVEEVKTDYVSIQKKIPNIGFI